MVIAGFAVGTLLKRTGKEILDDGVLGLAAQTAYYFLFSLFPLFLFLAPLLGVLGDKQENFQFILDQLQQAVPAEAFRIVADVARQVVLDPNAPGVVSLGAILALWSGSNIFTALIDALNRAYDVKDTRPWWKKKLISLLSVVVAGSILLIATIILVAGEDIANSAGGWLGLDVSTRRLWATIQVPVAVLMLIALAWSQYLLLPNLRQSKWHALVGALVTVTLWIIVTLLFRAYVQNFANYNKTYGAFGGVIVLLTWMYLSMLVLLAGGELASELHKGTGAIEPRRGAVLNNWIASGTSGHASADRESSVVMGKRSEG